jgi:hypothetical protein
LGRTELIRIILVWIESIMIIFKWIELIRLILEWIESIMIIFKWIELIRIIMKWIELISRAGTIYRNIDKIDL